MNNSSCLSSFLRLGKGFFLRETRQGGSQEPPESASFQAVPKATLLLTTSVNKISSCINMPIHSIFGNRVMLLGTRGQRGQTPALGHTARPTLPSTQCLLQPQMPLGGDLIFNLVSGHIAFYSPGRRPGFPISKGSF